MYSVCRLNNYIAYSLSKVKWIGGYGIIQRSADDESYDIRMHISHGWQQGILKK